MTTRRIADILDAVERIAPARLAEEWDNVGLIIGGRDVELTPPVLLTIDLTAAVLEQAIEMNSNCIVAYHPVLFRPTKRLTDATPHDRLLLRIARAGVNVCSPHTALDAAPGGLADWLIECAAGINAGHPRQALAPHVVIDRAQTHKLITFVPRDAVDAVRHALADAGAGRIGDYDQCSTVNDITGTFRGGDSTNPAVGQAGRLETVDETRLEMVCPASRLGAIVEALRAAHPYEEPAFDIVRREPHPDPHIGAGRAATLASSASLEDVAQRVRGALQSPYVKFAAAGGHPVTRLGVCPGAGSSLLDAAIAAGCDAFLTGEMSHHETLAALSKGVHVLLAGHTNTERGYLPTLAARIEAECPGVTTVVSGADVYPFELVAD